MSPLHTPTISLRLAALRNHLEEHPSVELEQYLDNMDTELEYAAQCLTAIQSNDDPATAAQQQLNIYKENMKYLRMGRAWWYFMWMLKDDPKDPIAPPQI